MKKWTTMITASVCAMMMTAGVFAYSPAESRIVNYSINDVQELVLKAYPNAKIRSIELDEDHGFYEYEVKFSTPDFRGEVKVNPETGQIFEREHKYHR